MSVSLSNLAPLLASSLAQFAEILDDAVMHDRDLVGGMRMRVVFGRLAMRRPAGVADADVAVQRLAVEPVFEVLQFAFGAPARQRAVLERRDAGGIIAAIFEPLQRIDQLAGDRLMAENSNNSAHRFEAPVRRSSIVAR